MKTIIAAIAIFIVTMSSRAQNGSVIFANRLAGSFDAPIMFDIASRTGMGTVPSSLVQLYIVNGTRLTPVGTPIGFRGNTDPLARYFDGGSIELPGTSIGGSVLLRVRAWVGASYATSSLRGQSMDFIVSNLGGGILPASHLENMSGFVIFFPEPAPLALGGLGFAILVVWSRQRS